MEHPALQKIAELAREPDALETTICYLADQLHFVKEREIVLICFPKHEPGSIGGLFEQVVLRRGAVPIFWENDLRWKALLRLAFSTRARTVVGPPLILLGLSKLARANATPLFIHNVVSAGYPCREWMIYGLIKGFDCAFWSCYGTRVVAGFSCEAKYGMHLREDIYGVDIVDENGASLPAGENGEVVIYLKADPSVRYPTGESACLETAACACGNPAPRLVDLNVGREFDKSLSMLGQQLQSWTSILDCRVQKGVYGLEMELVVFPGEKLPKLPTCAKQVIRPWNPEEDVPFRYAPSLNNLWFYG